MGRGVGDNTTAAFANRRRGIGTQSMAPPLIDTKPGMRERAVFEAYVQEIDNKKWGSALKALVEFRAYDGQEGILLNDLKRIFIDSVVEEQVQRVQPHLHDLLTFLGAGRPTAIHIMNDRQRQTLHVIPEGVFDEKPTSVCGKTNLEYAFAGDWAKATYAPAVYEEYKGPRGYDEDRLLLQSRCAKCSDYAEMYDDCDPYYGKDIPDQYTGNLYSSIRKELEGMWPSVLQQIEEDPDADFSEPREGVKFTENTSLSHLQDAALFAASRAIDKRIGKWIVEGPSVEKTIGKEYYNWMVGRVVKQTGFSREEAQQEIDGLMEGPAIQGWAYHLFNRGKLYYQATTQSYAPQTPIRDLKDHLRSSLTALHTEGSSPTHGVRPWSLRANKRSTW